MNQSVCYARNSHNKRRGKMARTLSPVKSFISLMGLFSALVFCDLLASASTSNILFLSPITAPSHSNFFKPVVRELVNRGHFVTYWNGLKPGSDMGSAPNFRQLFSERLGQVNAAHGIGFEDRNHKYYLFFTLHWRIKAYCTAIYQDPIFNQLMTTNEQFDLIVVEGVMNDCVLPLVHILKAPFIYMNGIAPTPWLLDALGSPLALDRYPNPGFGHTDRMNLFERAINVVSTLSGLYFRKWIVASTVDHMATRILGPENVTSILEIEDRYLSLLITNTHFSINYQLPTTSAVIEAGGLHCHPSKALPKELEDFVEGSGDAGFIIVSFGSILRGSNMPEDVRRSFIATFARLRQRVVWKWEDDGLGMNSSTNSSQHLRISPNVMLLPWLPQQDLLGHPKARLFITHGGLFSNQEAVYHGVPVITLPVFADQPLNAQKMEDDGYGLCLDWDNLNEKILYDTIQQILTDSKYSEKMKQVSNLMRDQMDHPLDRAVYWIEYVIRHRGAPHLRPPGTRRALYERGLLDVSFLLLSIFIFILTTIFYLSWSAVSKLRLSATPIALTNKGIRIAKKNKNDQRKMKQS